MRYTREVRSAWLLFLLSTYLPVTGCGDDDRGGGTTCDCCGTPVAASPGEDCRTGLCDPYCPPAPRDSGPDARVGMDSGVPRCFPLSGPSPELPDAIPASLTGDSPTWMRPTGELCPATGLGDTAVPYETVCYVNDTGSPLGVTFEMLVAGTPLVPAVVVYDGDAIPTDPTQCAAISTDLVIDAAEAYDVVPDGATVTLVGTVQDPGEGDFQFVITPD